MVITMKRFLICFIVFLLTVCICSSCGNSPKDDRDTEMVYICVSNTAYAYHKNESCQRLHQCTHEIKMVSKKEAEEKYGRKPCNWCTSRQMLNSK